VNRKNFRECLFTSRWLALWLPVVLALASAACRNVEAAKAEHIKRGESLLAEQKFQEAALEFRNVLQLDERSGAGQWGLARAYEGLERYSEAFNALRKTVELAPDNLDARVKLGHYYLSPGELSSDFVQAADKQAREVLARDPNHIEGHVLLAAVMLAQNRHDEARRLMQRAVELNPQRAETQLALARFYLKLGEKDSAEAALQKALALGGNTAGAQLEHGKYLAQTNRFDQAEAAFRKAVELEPKNRAAHLTLAGFLFATKQFDKAEQAYQALAAADPSAESRAALADFYAANGRLDAAANAYQQILQQYPDFTRGRTRLGEILLQRGDLAGAAAQAETLLKQGDAEVAGRVLRGRVRLQNNETHAAQDDLLEALKQDPSSRDALYYMALSHFRGGQNEQAGAYANELEKRYPDDLPGKLMRLHLTIAKGDTREAFNQAHQLLQKINAAATQGAILPQVAADLGGRTLTARASLSLQSGDVNAARNDFNAVRDSQPNSPDAYNNLALVARRENKFNAAAALYEKALSLDADNFEAWSGYVTVAKELKTLPQLQGRLEQVAASQPTSAPLQYLRGQLFTALGQSPEAEAALQRAVALDPNYLPAYTSLAALYLNDSQDDRALEQYRKIVARRPNDSNTFVLMGLVEDRRGNFDAAAEHYRKALGNDPNNAIAANNLAWIYAEYKKGSLDEALRLAQLALRLKPDVVGYTDTLGWVYHRKGLHPAAVEQLQMAVKKDAREPLYRYHLGAALAAAGRRAEARRELETALQLGGENFAKTSETRQILAQL
jgi:tetratricopeptide (TPR) repeat protein